MDVPEFQLLMAIQGKIQEKRLEPTDQAIFKFHVMHLTTKLVRARRVKLYLLFDFTGTGITIEGREKSEMGPDVLKLPDNAFLPNEAVPYEVKIRTSGATPQTYTFVVAAHYDVELIFDPGKSIGGGAQFFTVTPD